MAAGKCKAAYHTDEWHGYGCSITEGACMFLFPDSKRCAQEYGEGPDAEGRKDREMRNINLRPCLQGTGQDRSQGRAASRYTGIGGKQ